MKVKLILFGHSGTVIGENCGEIYVNCDTVPRVGEVISLRDDKEFIQSYPNEPVIFLVQEVTWYKKGWETCPELECRACGSTTDEGVSNERWQLLEEKGWLSGEDS